MEIIIGREEGGSRLHCVAAGREFFLGQAGFLPESISIKHCKITVDGNHISIENIKIQNITYVDGDQVQNKVLTVSSKVQLGAEKIAIPLRQILQLAIGKSNVAAVPTFSLNPMEAVWERYNEEMLQIDIDVALKQKKERKKRNLQGLCSSAGMLFVLIPQLGYVRFLLMGISVIIMLYFFLKKDDDDIAAVKKNNLREEFTSKYKCPNPECGKPFGNIPYHQIKFYRKCLACGCNYTVTTPPNATEANENGAPVTVLHDKGVSEKSVNAKRLLFAAIALMAIVVLGVYIHQDSQSDTSIKTSSPSVRTVSQSASSSDKTTSQADISNSVPHAAPSSSATVPEVSTSSVTPSVPVSKGVRPEPVEETGSAKKDKEEAHKQASKIIPHTSKIINDIISFPFGTYSGPDDGKGNGNRGVIRVTSPYTLSTNGDDLHLEPGDEIRNVQIRSGEIRAGIWIHNDNKVSFNR